MTRIGDIAHLMRFLASGQKVDLVFNYAAGRWGHARQAQVPPLLEAMQIPCTGADAFTLTVCIDKAIIKRLWRSAGLPTPDFWLVADPDSTDLCQSDRTPSLPGVSIGFGEIKIILRARRSG